MKKFNFIHLTLIIVIIQIVCAGLFRYEHINSIWISLIPTFIYILIITIFAIVVYFTYKYINRGDNNRK